MKKLSFFQKGDSRGLRFFSTNNQLVENVFFVYIAVIFFFLIVLFLRLFQLTIVKGNYYRNLSEQNRIREINIEAARGEIVDRKGFIIAQNLNPNINQELNLINLRYTDRPKLDDYPSIKKHLDKFKKLLFWVE